MKFLADMGISPRTVEKLRREGYDAVHLVEEKLEKLEDREILTKAREEGRIILTSESSNTRFAVTYILMMSNSF